MRLNETVIDAARAYVRAGFSVIPIKTDGSKRPPPVSWKLWQSRRASPYEIGQMFRADVGLAILGGVISGGLELLDFDRAEFIDPWIARVEAAAQGLIARLPRVRTPKGGAHFYYRCSTIEGNQKLAQEPPSVDKEGQPKPNTLIETRGEGGYVLAPPSPPACHPLGIPYRHVSGPPILETPKITPEERTILIESARYFNSWNPVVVDRPAGGTISEGDRIRPGDDFNDRGNWEEILCPFGWKVDHRTQNETHWCRPGKKSGVSATTGHCGDGLYIFSSNAQPFQPSQVYTKFAAYTLLNHNGDYTAAAKDLQARGYGDLEKAKAEVEEFEKVSEIKKVIEPTAFTPQNDYKKKKDDEKKGRGEFFDGKEFLPAPVARELMRQHTMIASPVSQQEGMGLTLFMYDDGYFKSNGSSVIRSEVDRMLADQSKTPRIQSVIDLLRERCKKDYRGLNRKACQLINVENGMLDWKTGELLPHDESYFSTIRINASWNPDIQTNTVDKFLEEVFPSDALLLAEEILGYLLIPSTKFHKSFVLVGEGANGKSRFIDLIKGLAGDENVTAISLHDIEDGRFAKANLFGKLVNVDSETADKILKSTAQFKSITGEDLVMGEHKGKDPFFFTPFVRMVFSANRFPRSNDPTKGYFRRLVMIPFDREFTEQTRDLDMTEKLLTPEARSRALFRAVQGLKRLMEARRFTDPDSSKKVLEDYKRECNSAYDFAQSFTAPADNLWIRKGEVYEKYTKWCRWGNLKPFSEREFNKILSQALKFVDGRERTDDGSIRVWKGIRWNDHAEEELNRDEREVGGFGVEKLGKWTDF